MLAWLSPHLSKPAAILILVAALLAVAGVSALSAIGKVSDLIEERVASARAERDAYWRSEVAEANAALSGAIAELARQAMRADGEIRAAETAAHAQLQQMEEDNAALPDGDGCGLGARRLQLLPR